MVDASKKAWTDAELMALPKDGRKYELVHGVLEMPPSEFWSERVGLSFGGKIDHYASKHDLGECSGANGGYRLDPDTLLAPDVGFLSNATLDRIGPFEGFVPGAPDLAVEVLSPSDRWLAVTEKVQTYLRHGTKLVWVLNPRELSVYVYRSNGESVVLREDDVLSGEDVLPGYSISVRDIFPRRRT
jgi:Uma2 family endonuclease